MKEKTLKLMSRYLLFGVLTCMIGFGAASCGEDYDDAALKSEMKGLKETLTALQGSAITSTNLDKAVKDATDVAKAAIMKDVEKMITAGSSYNAEQVAQVLGQLMALSEAFTTSPQFAQAVNSLEGVVGEAATKANTPAPWVKAIVDYNTRITALEVQANAVKGYVGTFPAGATLQGDIAKLKAELEAQIATGGSGNIEELAAALAKQDAFIQAIAEQINSTNPDLVSLTGMMNRMVTGISMLTPTTMSFVSGAKVVTGNYVFGTGYEGAISFVKDANSLIAQKVIVRVTPSNAILAPNKISLIDSEGKVNINNYVQAVTVKPYTKLITRAGTPETGLYEVSFDIKSSANFKEDEFKAAALVNPANGYTSNNRRAFAIALTTNESADRHVLTDFASSFVYTSATKAVHDDTGVELSDRKSDVWIKMPSSSYYTGIAFFGNRAKTTEEKGWKGGIEDFTVNTGSNLEKDTKDDRSGITSSFSCKVGESLEMVMSNQNDFLAYYIDIDMANAFSDEKPLWEAAKGNMSGLKKVYLAKETAKLTINDANLKGKEIGFRVYAVNYDGTYVDPDGRAFYMKVETGNVVVPETEVLEFQTIISKHIASSSDDVSTTSMEVPYMKNNLGRVSNYELTINIEGWNRNHNITGVKVKDGKDVETASLNDEATKIKLSAYPYNMANGKVYEGTLTLKDNENRVLATYSVKLSKTLPTIIPSELNLKTNDVTMLGTLLTNSPFKAQTPYAIFNAKDKKITMVPIIPALNTTGTSPVLDKAMYYHELSSAAHSSTLVNMNSIFVDVNVVSMTLSGDKIGEGTEAGILSQGYPNKPTLKIKYDYGQIDFDGTNRFNHMATGTPTGISVEMASVLAGYQLDVTKTRVAFSGFDLTNGLGIAVPLNWTPFVASSPATTPFTAADFAAIIDRNTFAGTLKYLDKDANEQSVTLKLKEGFDATNANAPVILIPVQAASKLAQASTTAGVSTPVLCNLEISFKDMLGGSSKITKAMTLSVKIEGVNGHNTSSVIAADF